MKNILNLCYLENTFITLYSLYLGSDIKAVHLFRAAEYEQKTTKKNCFLILPWTLFILLQLW